MIQYQLDAMAANRRAMASAAVGAATSLAPMVLALELVPGLRWSPPAIVWVTAAGIGILAATRVAAGYLSTRRHLVALRVTLDNDFITFSEGESILEIRRAHVGRVAEIFGPLGGLRVESVPEACTARVLVANVPRGGANFGDLRAALAQWRPIERRPTLGRGLRVLFGVGIVGAIFFLPFLLDDLAGHSRVAAPALVFATWVGMRWATRGR